MDENESDDKASSSLFSRLRTFRSPSFQQNEVKALLQLVEKYKFAILNKSTNSAANNAKEKAWAKVAFEFNKQGLGPKRTADVLKTKWENLKRNARKLTKDVMDDDCDFSKDMMKKTAMMICTTENIEFDDKNNSHSLEDDGTDFNSWVDEEEDNPAFGLGPDDIPKESTVKYDVPTGGFSPRDCKVLLQCVRQEKKVLFSKTSLVKRQEAWKRVAVTYNNQNARKKTAKELSRKFNSMKCMARKINFKGIFKNKKRKKYEQLDDDKIHLVEKIKSEPIVDCTTDAFDLDTDDEQLLNNPIDNFSTNRAPLSFAQDPLNNAHSSDSGLGSIADTNNIARLKLELLNYKMETARLERKRVEDAIKGDEREREMRAAEQTLRVRAARLALAAEEDKLPASHPALAHTGEEKRTQRYLSNSHQDIG